ncbi:acylneuraminate cytidylyltransferase family protein [Candidatus Woesearchaeota archaeon]|nr:acylneuraminate cytidylyltransferase family protein [Candidatus Woesearchaeota archaeon]
MTEEQPRILVTICARGGSKGIKNKNIKELAGKPLIAYTIETAKKWGKASRIICSTDSEQIAQAAKKYGAEVPFMRPTELATDTAGKLGVIRHAWKECKRIYNEKYDIVIDLDVTSPLRTVQDIENALAEFIHKQPDILFSVVEARKNPYFNMVELDERGYAHLSKQPNKPVLRRQDAPKVYDMNASMYFYSINFMQDESHTTTTGADRISIYVMTDINSMDIDKELDFNFIEFMIKQGIIRPGK